MPPSKRAIRNAEVWFGVMLALTIAALPCPHAHAQTTLEASYSISMAGITVGKAAWVVEIVDGQYTISANGRVSGVLRAVAKAEGSASAEGAIVEGHPVPTGFKADLVTDEGPEQVRLSLDNGTVTQLAAEPAFPPVPDRVPVGDADRQGVIDPLSAVLMPVEVAGQILTPAACQRSLPIFDGRRRFDVALSFKRMEKVKINDGYQGAVVVCRIVIHPIAGHRTKQSALQYLVETREIEIWLAPVAATRLLAPFKVSIPTLIGTLAAQATEFTASTQVPAATPPADAKAQ